MKTEQEKRICDFCEKTQVFDKHKMGSRYFANWIEITFYNAAYPNYSPSDHNDFCSIECCFNHLKNLIQK